MTCVLPELPEEQREVFTLRNVGPLEERNSAGELPPLDQQNVCSESNAQLIGSAEDLATPLTREIARFSM